jgi:tetraacyldisaccharide 4'-kinase
MNLSELQKKFQKNILGKAFLFPFSLAYGTGVLLRKKSYKSGIFKTKSVNSKVICIGNLTTGGAGKTTAVMFLARLLAAKNIKVAIISRGYKRKTRNQDVVIIDENTRDWRFTGDEPYMMYKTLEKYKIPVVVCANRYKACQTAIKKFQSQILLLDDGFSHIKLKRDLDIMLIDCRCDFLKDKLLPLGTLREPKSALARAGLILLTHCDIVDKNTIARTITEIKRYNPEAEIIKTRHKPTYFFDICGSRMVNLKDIKGRVAAFSAIGNPVSFEDTLKNLNLETAQIWRYPDHHPYTVKELETIYNLKGELPLITTYKDFIRLPLGWQKIFKENVYFLSVHLDIIGGYRKINILKESLGKINEIKIAK